MVVMRKLRLIIMGMFLMANATYCIAAEQTCYSNLSEVMKCFVSREDGAYKYKLQNENQTETLTVKNYILDSQQWPIEADDNIATTIWRHKLTIYAPKLVEHNQAMFYVSGGNNIDITGQEIFAPAKEDLEFANIAIKNKAPVVVLEDVPNQYLFIDSVAKKEDQILAFTYKKVM